MIPFLDLKAQYRAIQAEVTEAMGRVLASTSFVLGRELESLEQEFAAYCGTEFAIGVANGTDALLLTLVALGIGRDEAVITVPNTFFATAEAISHAGATPIFVDIDPASYNMSPARLEEFLRGCRRHTRGGWQQD